MVFECCVPTCDYKGINGLHGFPANEAIARKWINLTGAYKLKEKVLSRSHYKVCRKHFAKEDFQIDANKTRLVKNALPCLFLPNPTDLEKIRKMVLPLPSQLHSLNQPVSQLMNTLNQTATSNSVLTSNVSHEPDKNTSSDSQVFQNIGIPIKSSDKKKLDIFLQLESLKKEKGALLKKLWYYKDRAKDLEQKNKRNKLNNVQVLNYVSQKFTKPQFEFFKMQLVNCGKKPHARRYTAEQKSLCLAMYKQSAKSYRFKETVFILPTKKTIGRHSANLIFNSGIDHKMLAIIKENVKNLQTIDTHCIIAWDEMSLKPHIDYSPTRDVIDGFVEMINIRKPVFATHELTFMVRGIRTAYKQPIAHFFTNGLKAIELAELVKLIIDAVLDTGLNPLGSVCDQVATNSSAVDILMGLPQGKPQDGRLLSYKIQNSTLIHCFDAPHLIKVVRNNLEKKNLTHQVSRRWDPTDLNGDGNICTQENVASWDDIVYVYNFNLQTGKQLLPKITEEHIKPQQLKMKVSVATQVFSQTFGNVMLRCWERKEISHDFGGTAQILLFFNDLFDSLNGSGPTVHNLLKSFVTEHSVHFTYWQYALKMLPKMYFIDKDTGKRNNRSSVLLKIESTIRGYIEIARECFNLNMTEISIRNTNQDGLENSFGCLRSCCQVNVSLTACNFRSAYGTMIVNNLTTSNSISTNCEKDSSTPLVNNVHELLMNYQIPSNNDINQTDFNENVNILFDPLLNFDSVEDEALPVASIYKKMLQLTKCRDCIYLLQDQHDTMSEYESVLRCPSKAFIKNLKTLLSRINEVIPHICYQKSIKKNVLFHIHGIELDAIDCPEHSTEILMKFKESCINYALFTFCKNVNDLLTGKIRILSPNFNDIEELALLHCKKGKNIGKHSDIYTLKIVNGKNI